MALAAVGLWSLASGAHALMFGIGSMCVARGVLGFGEGVTFPAGLQTVAESLPREKRSFGLGLAYSGGSLGAAITPLVVTPIAIRFGWRGAFVATMAAGLIWIVLWVWLGRRFGLGRTPSPVVEHLAGSASRWNRSLFASAAVYGLGAAPLAFGLYAAPLYLSRVLHVGQASLGHLLWIPPLGWEAGYLFWGRVSDARRARAAGAPVGLFGALCVAGFLIVLAPLAAVSPYPVAATMGLFFAEMLIAGGFVVMSLADGMERQPRENTGFLAGFAISGWALVTGILMPILGRFFDRGLYARGFWVVACLPVAGTLIWKMLTGGPMQTRIDG